MRTVLIRRKARDSVVSFIAQIENTEREILCVQSQRVERGIGDVGAGSCADQCRRQGTQRIEAALADNAFCLFGDDTHQSFDAVRFSEQRTVREGMVGFFRVTIALKQKQQCLIPGWLALLHDRADAALDVGKDFFPDFAHRTAERSGVFDPKRRNVCVIVKEGQIRSPAQPHFETRAEHHPQGDSEGVGPGLGVT